MCSVMKYIFLYIPWVSNWIKTFWNFHWQIYKIAMMHILLHESILNIGINSAVDVPILNIANLSYICIPMIFKKGKLHIFLQEFCIQTLSSNTMLIWFYLQFIVFVLNQVPCYTTSCEVLFVWVTSVITVFMLLDLSAQTIAHQVQQAGTHSHTIKQ